MKGGAHFFFTFFVYFRVLFISFLLCADKMLEILLGFQLVRHGLFTVYFSFALEKLVDVFLQPSKTQELLFGKKAQSLRQPCMTTECQALSLCGTAAER